MSKPLDRELLLPPHNLEAEEGVIGSVIHDNDCLDDVLSLVSAEDFYRDNHQVVFRTIADMWRRGQPVDFITLLEELKNLKKPNEEDALSLVRQCMDRVPHTANAQYYSRIVREKALARHGIELVNKALTRFYGNDFTSRESLQALEDGVWSLLSQEADHREVSASRAVELMLEQARQAADEQVDSILFPWADLQDLTNGMESGRLVVVGGRPGWGKSTVATNIANFAAEKRFSVLLISLEMMEEELGRNLVAMRSGVLKSLIKKGTIFKPGHEDDLAKVMQAQSEIDNLPLKIDCRPARTVDDVASQAKRMNRKGECDLLIVDHIGLMKTPDRASRDQRYLQLALATHRLKSLAKELSIPVVLLTQLKREAETETPAMRHMRESGDIEQDADIVLVVKPGKKEGTVDMTILKNRDGESNKSVTLSFQPQFARLANYSSKTDEAVKAGNTVPHNGSNGSAF